MGHSIPTPPTEDGSSHKGAAPRGSSSGTKVSRSTTHRTSKRANSHITAAAAAAAAAATSASSLDAHNANGDSKHKRVWKACERCRMKKTKCDGEFPCKRCKDDGLICTAGVRKKTEYKQLPRGYAEVLESTQFTLIATIHKLYAMVRNSETWELGEPEFNERGLPVVHDIAGMLGCIRPNSDIDLPVHAFPEDERGLEDLARQLERQEKERAAEKRIKSNETDSSICGYTERASSSEPDTTELDDYRKVLAGAGGNRVMLSPQSLPPYHEFDANSAPQADLDQVPLFGQVDMSNFQPWNGASQQGSMDLMPEFLQQTTGQFSSLDLLNEGLVESEFGTLKPHILSCPNPEVMMGVGDPMMFSGYDGDAMRM